MIQELSQNEDGDIDVATVRGQFFKSNVVHDAAFATDVIQNEGQFKSVVMGRNPSVFTTLDSVVHAPTDRGHDVCIFRLEDKQFWNVLGPVFFESLILGNEDDNTGPGRVDVLVDEPTPRRFPGVSFSEEEVQTVPVVQPLKVEFLQENFLFPSVS